MEAAGRGGDWRARFLEMRVWRLGETRGKEADADVPVLLVQKDGYVEYPKRNC